jgi:hypothetical protein
MSHKQVRQEGGIVSAVFATIALAGVIAYATMGGSSTSLNNQKLYETVNAQANTIKSQLSTCVNAFPDGNNGCTVGTTGGTTCKSVVYPLAQNLTKASTLTCPGAGTNINLFAMPGIPNASAPVVKTNSGFGDWQFINDGASGILIQQTVPTTMGNNIAAYLVNKGQNVTYTNGTLTIKIMP